MHVLLATTKNINLTQTSAKFSSLLSMLTNQGMTRHSPYSDPNRSSPPFGGYPPAIIQAKQERFLLRSIRRSPTVECPQRPHLRSNSSPSHLHLRHPRMVNANAGHHRPCRRHCPYPPLPPSPLPQPPPPGRPPPKYSCMALRYGVRPSRRGISTTCSAWRSPK